MALVLADRVRETSTSTGTTTISLGGAYTGFQTFLNTVGNGNTTYYTIANVVSGEWEVGIGTYTSSGNTLSRDTVFASSNSGALVNFSSGSKDVFITQPAERALYLSGTTITTKNAAFNLNGIPYASSTSGLTTGGALTFDSTTIVSPSHTANTATTGSTNKGPFNYGTLSFSDTGIVQSAQTSVNSYFQNVMQNTSAGASASAEFIAYNDQGTASTNYATVGINSSGYSGTGSINAAGYGYFLTASTDLVLGTIGANGIHFTTNSSATDALAISSTGVISIPSSGTANGVAYLNGSKQLTTGSALTFDGTTFGVGSGSFRIDATSNVYGKSDNTSFVSLYGGGTYNSGAGIGLGGSSNSGSANTIIFTRGAYVETARFDSAGNLGLGVTPSAWNSTSKALQIGQTGVLSGLTGANYVEIGNNFYRDSVGTYRYIQTAAANKIEFQTDGSYRWNQAASGAAGTPVNGTGNFTQTMTLDASGNFMVGGTGYTAAKITAAQQSDTAGTLSFGLGSGGSILQGLRLTTNNSLAFDRYNAGWFESARIDSSGRFQINATSPVVAGANHLIRGNADFTAQFGLGLSTTQTTGTAYMVNFVFNGTQVGSISSTSTATVYGVASDYRLKNNQAPLTGSGAFIDALQPKTWEWTQDGSKGVGFVAHEFAEVSPTSVIGEKDDIDADGNPKYQSMQSSSPEVIANLVAEIQSLRQRLADAGI